MSDSYRWATRIREMRRAAISVWHADDGTVPPHLRVIDSWWEPARQRTMVSVEQAPGAAVWPYCLMPVASDEEAPRYHSLAQLLEEAQLRAERAAAALQEANG